MGLVEQPIEAFAAPPDAHVKVGAELLANALDESEIRPSD